MSLATQSSLHIVEKLRVAEHLAMKIARENQIHAEPRELRQALAGDGTTVHGVLQNWIFGLIENRPEVFHDLEEAERFVSRRLRDRMLEVFPGACEL